MAPEVLTRKLTYLRQLLRDLETFRNASLEKVGANHYTVERLVELLVVTSCDILFHLLAERNIQATSYRDTFRLAGKHGLIPVELANRLQDAAGMRNILVHIYEEIDYTILHASVRPALEDFRLFVSHFEAYLRKEDSDK